MDGDAGLTPDRYVSQPDVSDTAAHHDGFTSLHSLVSSQDSVSLPVARNLQYLDLQSRERPPEDDVMLFDECNASMSGEPPPPAQPPGSQAMHPSPMLSSSGRVKNRAWVTVRIERIFESQVDRLLEGEKPLQLRLRTSHMRQEASEEETAPAKANVVFYPGKTTRTAWRFAVTLRILELIHEALVNSQTITKRDIYYRDPELFSEQKIVDYYVDNIAFTFGVPRSLLNVTATAKGLIVGAALHRRSNGLVVDARANPKGQLITNIPDGDTVELDNANWVLLVEKEATFHSLCGSLLWEDLQRDGVMVTAKGYPDVATRALLKLLSMPSPQNNNKSCPMFALVDFDPDGINILSTYKHGSLNLAHNNPGLALPSMCWIGVHSNDLVAAQRSDEERGLLRLTFRDRRKAVCILGREPCIEDGEEPSWRREVQTMLMLNMKAEIQLLEAREGGLASWIRAELSRAIGT